MSQAEDDLSDEEWYLLKISEAKSIERLKYLATNIHYDKWEESEFTKNQETMDRIRDAWIKRKREIEKP